MGFRHLRVINHDQIQPGQGFGTHPHRDMEIITYLLKGAVEHRDSGGNHEVVKEGEIQIMSAGSGIEHSEYNASATDLLELFQIWVFPNEKGIPPRYETLVLDRESRQNQLRLLFAPASDADPSKRVLTIHQDIRVYSALLSSGKSIDFSATSDRYYWLQMASGELEVNGNHLKSFDGAALSDLREIRLNATQDSEFLFFDLT